MPHMIDWTPADKFPENVHLISSKVRRLRRFLKFVPIPLAAYWLEAHYSRRYHYIASGPEDRNIRGVALQLVKRA